MKKDLQIYLSNHNSFFDKILIKKRLEILNILNFYLKDQIFEDVLDIGTTNDLNKSSNFIIKNLKNIKSYKCISNQRINSNLFSKILTKSITKDLSEKEIADFVPKKILGYINSGTTEDAVNFPTIRLPQQKDRHRFLHIHRNVPGVMAEINKVLASYQLNLVGQYLSTDPEVGYVISDVNNAYNPEVVSALKAIPNTRKFRVLY